MVGYTTLKSYEFTDIDDYFNYIVESKHNGNFDQVRYLISKLSKEQRIIFFQYMIDQNYHKEDHSTFTFLMIKLLSA